MLRNPKITKVLYQILNERREDRLIQLDFEEES